MTSPETMPNAFVRLHDLSKKFDDYVVSSVSLDITRGEILTLLGPSGCGKTTTLRMLAGLETPTSGRVIVGGEDVTMLPPHRRNVGLVFQGYALFPHLTASENVAFGLRERKVSKVEMRDRVRHSLEMVKLAHLGDRRPKQLSGGQQQRVALARALVVEPSIVLLDEPLSALDRKMREVMQTELRQLLKRLDATAVLVTHDQDEALALSDRVAVMNEGRIEQVASPREMYDRPATAFCASFLGLSNSFSGRLENGRVQLPSGASFACDAATGSAGRASVIVRPEEVQLDLTESPGAHRARVESVTYLGPTTHYRVVLASGEKILAVASGNRRTELLEGKEAWLHIAPGSWRVLRDEPVDSGVGTAARPIDEALAATLRV
ncbi:MAG: ABC transporter ATP-binding protein [Nocardioidaceae bacterium]